MVAAQPGTDFDSKVKNVVVSVIKISAIVWNQAQREVLPKDLFGTPIQRMGAQEEIAAFVSYVASDNAGFVTGKVDTFL